MSDFQDRVGTRRSAEKKPSLSSIESSVTRLLVSTKHLLESLTQWARQEADDKFVSDAYVKLGNDFRAAVRAFNDAGVEISDLGDVPKALRIVLESALSEAPTQENLDKFLPNIRTIIVNLLSRLKAKQSRAKEIALEHGSHLNSQTNSPKDAQEPTSSMRADNTSVESVNSAHNRTSHPSKTFGKASSSSNDALAKLQKGNVISRRASKRFSAYQYAKLSNFNENQLTKLPEDVDRSRDFQDSTADVAFEKKSKDHEADRRSEFIFLRIDDSTKKVNIERPVSMAHLRLLFVEKFAYSPGGSTFPDIYVLDSENNVSYELDEHNIESEILSGTLVFLKERKSAPNALSSLEENLQALNNRVTEALQQIPQQVEDAIASLGSKIQHTSIISAVDESKMIKNQSTIPSGILRDLELESRAIKQISTNRSVFFLKALRELQDDLSALKSVCVDQSSTSSHRDFMEDSYSKLSQESDTLLTKVDDLQDTMEALRKDVAQRGVRLGPKQLQSTNKDIAEVKSALQSLCEFIAKGKPTWKKIWEAELDKVCEEQQFFNLQDDLTRDLDEDIKKIEETFELIEKCSSEQVKQNSKRTFAASKFSFLESGESLHDLKDAVLNQVAALVPDHEGRLDAIARAERLREKERELANLDKFEEELGSFVGDQKLKKSGGIEELENKRREKDLENLKSSFGAV